MPAKSATLPINPPNASTSRTKWPFPRPPIAGLHDISPILLILWVIRVVFAPDRADILAASTPAWPPPITITSNVLLSELIIYFPIQNLLKILPKTSSTSTTPIKVSIALIAVLSSSAHSSTLFMPANNSSSALSKE